MEQSIGMTGSIVVTGGARGIGRAVSEAFARAGRCVVIADRDPDGAAVAAALTAALPGEVYFVPSDLRDLDSIENLATRAEALAGGIAVLVNNAAVTRVIDLFDVTGDDWNQISEINARGYFFALQACARRMRGRGGSIVNIASIAGKGWRETSNIAYAASKGGVIAMTRIAAARLGAEGIRVNAVCPGMTRTDIWSAWIDGRAAEQGCPSSEILAEMTAQVPTGALNTPDDVAQAVLFLASPAARNITGQSLNVDGGTVWD